MTGHRVKTIGKNFAKHHPKICRHYYTNILFAGCHGNDLTDALISYRTIVSNLAFLQSDDLKIPKVNRDRLSKDTGKSLITQLEQGLVQKTTVRELLTIHLQIE